MDYLNVPDSVENIISEVPYSHWKLTCLRPSFQYGTSDSGFKFIENEKGAYVDIPYHGREPMKESDLRFPIVYQVLEMMEMGSFSYLGTKNINDTLYHAVNGVMSSGKKEDTLLFDMTSYQLTFQINGANESMLARFSNYRSMEGFTIPLKTEVFYDGILFQQTMTDSVAFNIDVDKALFK
ncbi:MAG: hypothetical protein RIG68_02645 [Imperialibacter sp.]|uniref:hypothetical protein n=1 Tax=Imperialibacter sp. TaxID=2038411 RepID=UPI0032EE3651